MNNNNNTLSQKIKDNAFYIALGVGILAIIAVIAVYTTGRDGGAYEENEIDLNQSADYSSISDEGSIHSKKKGTTENRMKSNKDALNKIPDSKSAEDLQKKNVQISDRSMYEKGTTDGKTKKTGASDKTKGNGKTDGKSGDNNTDVTAANGANAESGNATDGTAANGTDNAAGNTSADAAGNTDQLPVTADVGELNFGSKKTLSWPVSGEVILPFSMETTVYYKTLDQYRTNPGMLIAAGSGSTVKSAYLGKVAKVTSDNTYGNLVTIYVGNDYSLVYGQLDTIYVKEGDYVKAGESIGTIGKPTDSFEDEGSHLFFQVLKKDTPVDPMEFME